VEKKKHVLIGAIIGQKVKLVIKRLDELETSALLEMQTASQDSIRKMEREESELEKLVSLFEKHLQQLDFLTNNGSRYLSDDSFFFYFHPVSIFPPILHSCFQR
jgi:type II secretory pathway component PulJ